MESVYGLPNTCQSRDEVVSSDADGPSVREKTIRLAICRLAFAAEFIAEERIARAAFPLERGGRSGVGRLLLVHDFRPERWPPSARGLTN